MLSFSGRLIGKFHDIRKKILRPENSFAFLSADLTLLQRNYGNKSTEPWINFFSGVVPHDTTPKDDMSIPFKTISEYENIDPYPVLRHVVAGLPGNNFQTRLSGFNLNSRLTELSLEL